MDKEHELNQVVTFYRGQGYDVTVQPRADQLPPFAKDFRVEILGRRGTEGVLVAVRKNRDEFAADRDVQRYAEIIGTQPGWRFDFAILEAENPSSREGRGAREFLAEDITRSLEQAKELSRIGFTQYAVIPAWAALEAAMRMRLRAFGQKAGWGSKPREMVKELYSAGAFTPDEFRRIEAATQIRNQVAHGFTPQSPPSGDSETELVQLLSNVADRLVNESQHAKQPA